MPDGVLYLAAVITILAFVIFGDFDVRLGRLRSPQSRPKAAPKSHADAKADQR